MINERQINDRMINFDESEIDEKKGRIIDGEISSDNAWPWQVSKDRN